MRWRKDGTLVDVSVTVSPIRDESGAIVGASKIARDISERKRIEAELADIQRRLMALAVAVGVRFSARRTSEAVLAATINVAREVFSADGYALWRVDQHGAWRIAGSFGISAGFAGRVVSSPPSQPTIVRVPFDTPQVFEDVRAAPMVAHTRDAYEREGIVSMVVFPLVIRGERAGTMVYYSRRRRTFSPLDVQVGTALAKLVAAALTTAELYDEQRRAREAADHARQQATFLAEAGTALSASLDYEATLASVARLAVPPIADWCAVDIIDERGELKRLAVAHVDPEKIEYARMLQERYPADPERTGRRARGDAHGHAGDRCPASRPSCSTPAARDEEHRRIIRELSLTSYMCVPLMAHGTRVRRHHLCERRVRARLHRARSCASRRSSPRAPSLAVENARAYARANEASRAEGRIPRHALARAAHAAQRRARLRADAATRHAAADGSRAALAVHRAQCRLAAADYRGRARRLADRRRPAPPERGAGRPAGHLAGVVATVSRRPTRRGSASRASSTRLPRP